MNEKQINELNNLDSIDSKIKFLVREQIEITPDVISLLNPNKYSSIFTFPIEVSKLINQLMKEFGYKSILDPFCGYGYLLYYIDDSIQKIGMDRNIETSRIAQILNPKASIEALDIINNPLAKKFSFVGTTIIPFSSDVFD